ncbi:low choriolytic enzyme-like [Simochromis diagramma]|uniref:low choriolytic enzyme-like n=1 Tax=Simochromis diagramma TaxID=43689 RepID=UPI001A7E5F12|nr:low choriolytic enzyme-like [Simochromis diagramma]
MTPAFFFSVCLSMTAVCLRAAVIRNITDESLGASAIIEKVNANSTKVLVHGDIVPTAHHEQVRSDRDLHVRILTANIIPGQEHNFVKVQTNNLGTPYDFNSVMHYGRFDFSKNGQPTIVARSNPNLNFGNAFQMSPNDIARVNRLYGC